MHGVPSHYQPAILVTNLIRDSGDERAESLSAGKTAFLQDTPVSKLERSQIQPCTLQSFSQTLLVFLCHLHEILIAYIYLLATHLQCFCAPALLWVNLQPNIIISPLSLGSSCDNLLVQQVSLLRVVVQQMYITSDAAAIKEVWSTGIFYVPGECSSYRQGGGVCSQCPMCTLHSEPSSVEDRLYNEQTMANNDKCMNTARITTKH